MKLNIPLAAQLKIVQVSFSLKVIANGIWEKTIKCRYSLCNKAVHHVARVRIVGEFRMGGVTMGSVNV
jgi:hypothetical protein